MGLLYIVLNTDIHTSSYISLLQMCIVFMWQALLLSACILHVYLENIEFNSVYIPSVNYSVSMTSREIVVMEDVGIVVVCAILSSSSPLYTY